MKLSNDVEKYEIEVTKMGQNCLQCSYCEESATYSTQLQQQLHKLLSGGSILSDIKYKNKKFEPAGSQLESVV